MVVPSSDELEVYGEQLRALEAELGGLGSKEVRDRELLAQLAEAAKSWMRYCQALRTVEAIDAPGLDTIDNAMQAILRGASIRTRASTFRRQLKGILSIYLDQAVIPLIRHEGSPAQVAARQIQNAFTTPLSSEEGTYIEEAARCVTVLANRAAIIMLWAAAMARFHQAVQVVGFKQFNTARANAAAKSGNPYNHVSKGPAISSLPELQRTRDFDILVAGMELWGYDLQVFQELNRLLSIRNDAAHPGMVQPSILDVQQFAAKVDSYVFAKVSV